MIRSSVQQAYLFGTGIVTDEFTKINDNFETFISVTDIQNIQQLTDKLNEQFWKTAGRLHRRETEFVVVPDSKQQVVSLAAGIIPRPLYDIAAAIIGFAAYVAYSAFNQAVVSKINVTEDQILLGNEQIGIDFGVDTRVMFLTQEDSAVDPEICEPLNRTVYEGDDPTIPEPPLHNHCRCRLIPIADVNSIHQ